MPKELEDDLILDREKGQISRYRADRTQKKVSAIESRKKLDLLQIGEIPEEETGMISGLSEISGGYKVDTDLRSLMNLSILKIRRQLKAKTP